MYMQYVFVFNSNIKYQQLRCTLISNPPGRLAVLFLRFLKSWEYSSGKRFSAGYQ